MLFSTFFSLNSFQEQFKMSEEDFIKEFHEVCMRTDPEELINLLIREKEIIVKRFDMNYGLHILAVKNESLR